MKLTKRQLRKIIKEELGKLQEAEGETAQEVADRLAHIPAAFRHGAMADFENMANGSTEMAEYYPHVKDLAAFGREVLSLLK